MHMKSSRRLSCKLHGIAHLMVSVAVLAGCTSPKAVTSPDGVANVAETANAVGVKGIALGVVRYPASGAVRITQHATSTVGMWLNPGMTGPGMKGERAALPPAGTKPGMDVAAFEAMLDRKLKPPRAAGTVELLIDGDEYFPRLSKSLREARRSVDMQVYIFDRDDFAVSVANELKQTSQRLPVRVIFDDLGTIKAGYRKPNTPPPSGFEQPEDMADYLQKDSSIRVRKLHNLFLTSVHTKIITFDSSSAHIGGMNIGREYRSEWHDMMAEVRGPIVDLLQDEFEHSWERASPLGDWRALGPSRKRKRPERTSDEGIAGAFDIRVFRTRPLDHEIQKAIHLAIDHAQRRVWIENPYFADDTIVRKLIEARQRGVDVRVVLPVDAKAKVLDENNEATANVMLKHGIRVFIYPRMTHIKAALFDGWAFIGSANYDRLSLRLNGEANIGYSEPSAVRELEQRLFLTDFHTSVEKKRPSPETGVETLSELAADAL